VLTHFNAQVAATSHTAATATLSAATAKKSFKRTAATKDIAKLAEYVFHIHACHRHNRRHLAMRIGCMAKLIVTLAFFWRCLILRKLQQLL
jgi:hypothetical protein